VSRALEHFADEKNSISFTGIELGNIFLICQMLEFVFTLFHGSDINTPKAHIPCSESCRCASWQRMNRSPCPDTVQTLLDKKVELCYSQYYFQEQVKSQYSSQIPKGSYKWTSRQAMNWLLGLMVIAQIICSSVSALWPWCTVHYSNISGSN
jgi:hypothetical protein